MIFGYRAGTHWYESALYTWFTISLNTFTNENIFLKKGGVTKLFFIEIIHIKHQGTHSWERGNLTRTLKDEHVSTGKTSEKKEVKEGRLTEGEHNPEPGPQ